MLARTRVLFGACGRSRPLATRGFARRTLSVILTERTELGHRGDVIKVQPGHARNHLFPKGLAVYATEENLGRFIQRDPALQKAEDEEKERQREQERATRLITKIHARVRRAPLLSAEQRKLSLEALFAEGKNSEGDWDGRAVDGDLSIPVIRMILEKEHDLFVKSEADITFARGDLSHISKFGKYVLNIRMDGLDKPAPVNIDVFPWIPKHCRKAVVDEDAPSESDDEEEVTSLL